MTDNAQFLVLPLFDRLRGAPRFRAVIDEMRLTEHHAKYLSRQRAPARGSESSR